MNENILGNYNQLFSKAIVGLNNKKLGSLDYSFENLNYKNYFDGVRNAISLISNQKRNLRFNSNSSIMKSNQNDYSSDFINTNNKIEFHHKSGWAEITYNYERKKSNGGQNLYNPDFGQEGYEFKRVLEKG